MRALSAACCAMPKAARADSDGAVVLCYVVDFLRKKRLDVPPKLLAACPSKKPEGSAGFHPAAADSAELQWALGLLPALKERERRALTRFVQRGGTAAASAATASGVSSVTMGLCSDDEDDGQRQSQLPSVRGGSWPSSVTYSNDYVWADDVTAELRNKYRPAALRPRAASPCPRTFSAVITEASHPAAGQCGLFAAADMPHGAWVIDYVGAVCLGHNEDKTSDYVSSLRASRCPITCLALACGLGSRVPTLRPLTGV